MVNKKERPKMRRPKQGRSRATVDAIIEAAAKVIQREGRGDVSTNLIAETAGVSVGSLYQFFSGREAVLEGMVSRHFERLSASLMSEVGALTAMPLTEAVPACVEFLLQARSINPRVMRVLVQSGANLSILEQVIELERRCIDIVIPYLEQRRHELRVRDIPLASRILVHLVWSTIYDMMLRDPEALHTEAFKRELVDLILCYLMRSPSAAVELLEGGGERGRGELVPLERGRGSGLAGRG